MIKVGILGAGGMGNVHARHYRRISDVDLTFFEPDQERAATYADKWQASPASSVDDLISRVDVVDVCLPTDLHFDNAMKAISAGRAVFVEKPIAGDLDQGVQMISAADKAGVVLMPGQVVRFFAEFAAGHRLVKAGKVGNPAAARTRRGGLPPRGLDSWFMDHARSGGVILDLAVHDFDWLRWTLGEVKFLYARSVGVQAGKGPDYALTTLTFDEGAVAHVEATWMDPSGFRVTFEVAGSGGIVEYDSRQAASLKTSTDKTVYESPLAGEDDPYYKQLSAFIEAVRKNTQPPVTGYDGLMAISIALAALESAKTGQVVAPARQF